MRVNKELHAKRAQGFGCSRFEMLQPFRKFRGLSRGVSFGIVVKVCELIGVVIQPAKPESRAAGFVIMGNANAGEFATFGGNFPSVETFAGLFFVGLCFVFRFFIFLSFLIP